MPLVRPWSLPLLVLIMAGCGARAPEATADNAPETAPEGLQQAQAVWDAEGIKDYRVTVRQTCFCPPDLRQPLRVTVADGEVVEIRGLEQPLQQQDQLDRSRLTVAGLFRFIRQSAEREPHKLEVEYDPRFGYPRHIDYDGHERIADDEFRYELTDFRTGK